MIEKAVLIIDDEKRMTDSLRDLLTPQGFDVETANSGAEGIEALKRREFPVVVTDIRMQGLGGLDVIRYVYDHNPKTLVLVITGYASTESAIEALHYQAFDYLRKPFEFDQFKAAIDRAFHKLEVDQLREDTAAMITHDIKIPLTSILGFSSMLYDQEKGEFHERAPEFAETIRSNAQKILALADNYLTTCRIEDGLLVLHPSKVRLEAFALDLVETISAEASKRGFRIESEIEIEPAEAVFDETNAFRAVGNLLQNAIKYGDASEPICLRIRRLEGAESPLQGDAIQFEVINTATNLKADKLDGLFGRYKRADNSGIEGSGIGLYVVDVVARSHGGKAAAQCLEGGRVSFSIFLPADLKPASEDS